MSSRNASNLLKYANLFYKLAYLNDFQLKSNRDFLYEYADWFRKVAAKEPVSLERLMRDFPDIDGKIIEEIFQADSHPQKKNVIGALHKYRKQLAEQGVTSDAIAFLKSKHSGNVSNYDVLVEQFPNLKDKLYKLYTKYNKY